MKVIDLFNMMAEGKPLPNKIKLQCVNSIDKTNNIYTFNPIRETWVNKQGKDLEDATMLATLLDLEIKIVK